MLGPCHEFGRAALPRRFGIKAVRQHSPTKKGVMGTKRVKSRKGTTLEPCERIAAFMPLQCEICEGIRIVPILLDVPTLRRNKFRDPRIMGAKRAKSRIDLPMIIRNAGIENSPWTRWEREE